MAIQIIVEDGSGVANANSYQTVPQARQYALNRGVELSNDDDVVAGQLISGTDYLETFACDFQGSRSSSTQALQWPRIDVKLYGDDLPSNVIPNLLQSALNQLVIAQESGIDLQPNYSANDFVIKEKVGPLETVYADPLNVGLKPNLTAVDALLAPLFGQCASSGFGFKTVRV
jgi:hypothetical protein